MKKLAPLLKKLGDGFKDASDALKKIKADSDKSPGPKPAPGGTDKGGDPPPKNDTGGDPPPKSDRPAGTSSQAADNPPPKNDGPPPPKNTPPPTDRSLDSGGPTPTPTNPNSAKTPPKGDQTTPNSTKPNNPNEHKTEGSKIHTGGSEPVDMANGHMVMTEIDLELQNPLSLVLERMYVSSYRAGRWFGPSWTSTLDQRLEVDEENVCYFSPDGMILVYPLPSADSPVLPVVGPRWPLSVREDGGYRLEIPQRARTMYFAPLGASARVQPLLAVKDEDGHRIDIEQQRFGPPKALQHSDGYRVEIDSEHERVTAVRVVDRENELNVLVMRYGYDDRGRLTEVINSSGKALRYLYDAAGRLNEWQDRSGFWFRYIYDEHGRVVRTVGDQGFFDSSFAYIEDSGRFVTQYTDSLGGIKEFEFNAAKQLVREADGLGNTTLSEWDRYDRLLSRTDPLGRTTYYEYDGQGRPSRITRPDGSAVELSLNRAGTVASITVSNGQQIWTRSYDDERLDPFSGKVGVAPELDLDGLRSGRGADTTESESAEPDRRLRDLFGRPKETATPDGSRNSSVGPWKGTSPGASTRSVLGSSGGTTPRATRSPGSTHSAASPPWNTAHSRSWCPASMRTALAPSARLIRSGD